MSIEVLLFIVVGAVSVAAATMMLLSENAVHSALFLILNFVCVAVLYLLLNASFLAMVQIAVYAGAIMVLFLFVIMLLGAEKTDGEDIHQFKWFSPITLALSMIFLLAVSVALFAGEIDTRERPDAPSMLRIANFASGYVEPIDVFLNGELAASNISFGDATTFEEIPVGDYSVGIGLAGNDASLSIPLQGTVTVAPDQIATVLVYGKGRLPSITALTDDLSTLNHNDGRVTVFNAYSDAPLVNLINPGSDAIIEPDENIETLVENLAFGEAATSEIYDEGQYTLAFVSPDDPTTIIARARDWEVTGGTSTLLVLDGEPDGIEGGIIPSISFLDTESTPEFGGPVSVGQALFTRYVLPFQMVAMLLLAAMVGAIVLTQRGDIKPKPGRPMRRRVSRPLTSVITTQVGHDVHGEPEPRPQLQAPVAEQPEAGD